MFTHKLVSAFVAAVLLSMASAATTTTVKPIPSPTQTLPAHALVLKGCFSTPTPLVDYGPYLYQSEGNCQQICLGLGKPVMALSDGSNCWCGDLVPPASAKVGDGNCTTTCGGGDDKFCGGNKHYFVELTGQSRNNIDNFVPEVSSSSTSAVKQTSAAAETSTATVTIPPKSSNGGPNKAGIAAGVVVGVLALAGIIAGVYFFLRRQRRRELEEEHRRQAAVSSFVSGGKLHTSNSSITDSRLDPEFMNRRQSNGSIADNEDYSRRILKVTNA